MKAPSFYDSFQVLLLQLSDEQRGDVLLGDSASRLRVEAEPFFISEEFPSLYFELPLIGDPFCDLTLLYENIAVGSRVNSPAATDTGLMLDWFAETCADLSGICCGFELDTKEEKLPRAAVHFQPRTHTELVEPFCEAIGEPERAKLYLDLAARMPKGWPLSFFGLFRGRPGSPLRVCGYLDSDEQDICAKDPLHLKDVFDSIGFTAYDEDMLADISKVIELAARQLDFQFDVYPDATLGNTFAIDASFAITKPEVVRENFQNGYGAHIMEFLESRGAADGRWRLAVKAALARALPVELDNGGHERFAFTLLPQWAKVRWHERKLQPAKLYFLGTAGVLEEKG